MGKRFSLIVFVLATSILGGYYGAPFIIDKVDKRVHLPGSTSIGHHQIEMACEQCHTPFGGVKNDSCNKCHAEALQKSNNSHGDGKFMDPHNADRISSLDAQYCVTCHREHVPDQTKAGVTIADDFCVKCHADVFKDRPSHAGLSAQSCGNAGCHNFHDNRALYSDFLLKHLDEPSVNTVAHVPFERSQEPAKYHDKILSAKDADAPDSIVVDAAVMREWEASGHAKAGVNCMGCHRKDDGTNTVGQWTTNVDHRVCAKCHQGEDDGFLRGMHGMRLAAGLPPMTAGLAQLPMKPESKERGLNCATCHGAHGFNTRQAAVEACLGCHADKHGLAYKASQHFRLWELEQNGTAGAGTGVSCATCHLPREVHKQNEAEVVSVQHNQNDNLRPTDKMLRSVCMNCHGLGFSMDALADDDLIQRNFNGKPHIHVRSLEMARDMAKKQHGN